MTEEYAEPSVEDVTGDVDGESTELPGPPADGSEAAIREPAPIAGRYRIGEYLATSRLGRTYRAWDSETDQGVEVTFLDADAVTDAPGVEAWLEELRSLRHLHVLPLLDWEIAPVPYLVYAEPEMRLDRLISARVALTPSQTLLIGLQAAETLHNLCQRGITHGALTPAHCCVEASGRLRLAELGVDFLRAPLEPGEATRYDAPETIRFADFESPGPVAAGDEDPAQWEGVEAAETLHAPGAPGDAGSAAEDETEDATGEFELLSDAGSATEDATEDATGEFELLSDAGSATEDATEDATGEFELLSDAGSATEDEREDATGEFELLSDAGESEDGDAGRRDVPFDGVPPDRLAADDAAADRLAARDVAARDVAARDVAARDVAADDVAADDVAADDVAADRLAADRLAACDVAADDVAADRLAAHDVAARDVAADRDAAESPARVDLSPPPADPGPPDSAQADVYALGLTLTEVAAGRPVARPEIAQLGEAIVPLRAGQATARHLARLAPLLVQATATRPENRLEADELALALRATAEMLPPPSRLDEAFRRVGDDRIEPGAAQQEAAVPQPLRRTWPKPLIRMVAAAAVLVAAALLVLSSAGGDDMPTHTVPDVVGMDWTRASDTLTASGWEVRRLEVRVAAAAVGEVVGQLPEPGGLLDEGQVVKVQVSLGQPLVVIPADIVGLPLTEAGLRLSEVGLALGTVESRVDPSLPAGSVVAVAEMLPELPRGSQVDLVIAVGR